jgi:integrase
MAKREHFTATRVAGFQCEAGRQQTIYWDDQARGLGLRVTASGAKSYIFEGWLHGKSLRVTIGDIKTWPIDSPKGGKSARSEATRLKTLTDQGIDPRQLAAEQRAKVEAADAEAKQKSAFVSDAWKAYIDHQKDKMLRSHIERGKKWGERHLLDHERMAHPGGAVKKRGKGLTKAGPLHPLMQMRIADVTADTLKDWQRGEAETRANNARQAFEMFRAFWRWCATRQEFMSVIDPHAVESKELRDEVPSRKSKRFDVLESTQLPAWFSAVRGLSNPVISAYLQALMLTGARREEMAGLRWDDVDFKWGSLWVKDKVAEEGRKIPLTPYLFNLLSTLPRRNEWVFSSPAAKKNQGRLAEPRIAHNQSLTVAGLPMVTLHGLRRTFISLAEWVEMPTGIVAEITGHKPSATAEKHYKKRPLDLLRVWHTKYEAWLLEQAGIAQPSEGTATLRLVKLNAV